MTRTICKLGVSMKFLLLMITTISHGCHPAFLALSALPLPFIPMGSDSSGGSGNGDGNGNNNNYNNDDAEPPAVSKTGKAN